MRVTLKNESGVSLIESLLVIIVLSAIILLMANLPNALGLVNKSKHLSLAREIAVKQIEDKKATSYANLVPGTTNITVTVDPRMTSLPGSSGTVKVEDCDPLVSPQFCPNSEHIKIITVTINWKDNNKPQTTSLNTFIGEGGLNQ